VVVELIQSGFAEKQVAALALTACSVTYGTGQILTGWLGDRFKPQNIIFPRFFLSDRYFTKHENRCHSKDVQSGS